MRMRKWLIGALTVLALVLAAQARPVHAAEIISEGTENLSWNIITWSLDSDSVLNIDSNSTVKRPQELYDLKDQIRHVIIGDEAKAVGETEFLEYTSIETVVIGKNVQTIYAGAFNGCTALKK